MAGWGVATTMDVRDADEVAGVVLDWVRTHIAPGARLAAEARAVGDGFDNAVHFVQLAGDDLPPAWREPLVVRVQPDADRFAIAGREAAVQSWCVDAGYPAPQMLAVLAPGEVCFTSMQIMQRSPGDMMLRAMLPRLWRAPALIDTMAELHVRLHRLDTAGWPEPQITLAARRIEPVVRWCEQLDEPQLRTALDRVRGLVPELDAGPLVPCHGDFHPLNVIMDGRGRAAVIDWTDAALGDRHGDVARTRLLFLVAAVAAGSAAERAALRLLGPRLAARYLHAYGARWPLDEHRLRRWETVHLLQGWGQVLALHAGVIGDADSRARVPVALADWLGARLRDALGAVDA